MRARTSILLALCCCFTGCSVARLVYSRPPQRSTEQQELAAALKAQQALEQSLLADQERNTTKSEASKARIASRIQKLSSLQPQPSNSALIVESEAPPAKSTAVKAVSYSKAPVQTAPERSEEAVLVGRESRI